MSASPERSTSHSGCGAAMGLSQKRSRQKPPENACNKISGITGIVGSQQPSEAAAEPWGENLPRVLQAQMRASRLGLGQGLLEGG